MAVQDVKKSIRRELKEIESEYDVKSWEHTDPEDLEPGEAYNRGYYRALQSCLSALESED